ncbi:hypothetical protein Pmani_006061 [Petrolisthes manimaculis]|uniref:Uncharacterized protein n=1 Tax=Petrolisthes manimaculis TaxID=1843537 RepID=A0AAE1QBP4_9EUCA|nr:hypothetical protein Pmani_006061 [Petrolisthes manimaculis]
MQQMFPLQEDPTSRDGQRSFLEDEDSDAEEKVQEKIKREVFEGSDNEDEGLEAVRNIFSCDIDYGEFEDYEECADEENIVDDSENEQISKSLMKNGKYLSKENDHGNDEDEEERDGNDEKKEYYDEESEEDYDEKIIICDGNEEENEKVEEGNNEVEEASDYNDEDYDNYSDGEDNDESWDKEIAEKTVIYPPCNHVRCESF